MKYETDYYSNGWLVFAEAKIPVTSEAPEEYFEGARREATDRVVIGREESNRGRGGPPSDATGGYYSRDGRPRRRADRGGRTQADRRSSGQTGEPSNEDYFYSGDENEI